MNNSDNPEVVSVSSSAFGLLDFLVVTAENLKLLIVATIIAGALALAVLSLLPKTYTSVSYLNLSPREASEAEFLIRFVAVGIVAEKFPDLDGSNDTADGRKRALAKRVRWGIASGLNRNAATIYQLEVDQTNSDRAKNVNDALVSAWLDLTKPKPNRRAMIEDRLRFSEVQLGSMSKLEARLEMETVAVKPTLVEGGVSSAPLLDVLKQKAKLEEDILKLKAELAGKTRDVVVAPASRSFESVWPRRRAAAIAAMLVSLALAWLFVVLREAVRRLGPEDLARQKLRRAAISLRLPVKT